MLTKFAIEKKRIMLMILIMIFSLGVVSFFRLPKAEDPGFIVRKARVVTYFPGASPERIEQLVSDKIEEVIQQMPELEFVISESRTGISIITVKMRDSYKNMRPIWDTLRRKVEKTKQSLPQGVIGPFVNDEFGDVFGTIVAISGEGYTYKQLNDMAKEVRDELLFIDEIAKVEVYGEQEERIFIEYDDSRLSEFGLSSMHVKEFLENRNIVIPGGSIAVGNERIILEPSGNFESIEDLKNTVVKIPGKEELIYIKDLSDVKRGYIDPPTNIMHFSGKPCIALGISLREGGNITKLGEDVKNIISKLEKRYPVGINFDFVVFESEEVTKRVDTFVKNLLQSITIVLAIMLASLGVRTGFIVAGLIPMTILSTFVLMSFFNIGIDQTSLASLIIALGMLVDNSIVICEAIVSEVSGGKDVKTAAIEATSELKFSLLTSSLTTSFAFLPIFLAESMAGEYTVSIFKVVTIALLCSWILAITMIPMLCCLFLKFTKRKVNTSKGFYIWYRVVLNEALKTPGKYLCFFVIGFGISLLGFLIIPKSFFPPSNRPMFTIKYELPVGTRIEYTQEVVKKIENYFQDDLVGDNGGIINWTSFIGGVTPRYVLNHNPIQLDPEEAFMIVNVKDVYNIPELMTKIEKYAHDNFPDLRISLELIKYGPPVSAPVAIRISGIDQEKLFTYVDRVKEIVKESKGTKNIRDNWGEDSKKIVVQINQPRALRAGVSNKDIAISLQTKFSGLVTTQYRENNDVIPITFRTQSSDRENLNKLESLHVYSLAKGTSVPLKQVADFDLIFQPNNIIRRNRIRTVTVMADTDLGYNPQKIANGMKSQLNEEKKSWDESFFYEFGGEKESSEISRKSIMEQIPIAFLLILLLLIIQFNSFRQSFIILTTIPMGIVGVIFGLIVTNSYFGFMTLLGVVSLSGIVINDAIVLIERINLERRNGLILTDAIVEASLRRARPILLTTFTTVGGMMPLWLGGGQLFQTMAIAIIFGLIFATFLTLGFVPLMYGLFYKRSKEVVDVVHI